MSNLLNTLTTAKLRQRVNRNLVAIASKGGVMQDELCDKERSILGDSWERMATCASNVVLGTYHDGEKMQQRLVKARFCGMAMVCPICAKRRGYLAATRYQPRIVESLAGDDTRVLAMMTLTLENQANLREGLELLRDAWRSFLDRARWYRQNPLRNAYTEGVKILGSVRSFEVKRARDHRFWHPHLHAAVILSEYIDREALSEEWRKLTGGSFIVHLRRIDDLQKGLQEVLKYPCKFGDLAAQDHVRIWRAFRGIAEGKRILAMSSTGCLRGAQFDEDDLDIDETATIPAKLLDFWVWSNDRKYELLRSRMERPESRNLQAAREESRKAGAWGEYSWGYSEGLAEENAILKAKQRRRRLPDPCES